MSLPRSSLPRRAWWPAVALAAVCALLAVAAVNGIDWLGYRELETHQWWLLRTPIVPDSRIVLVSIEPETPEKLGLKSADQPLPRGAHAQLIQGLRRAGTRSLLMDLVFTGETDDVDDAALREALRDAAPMHVTLATEEREVEEDAAAQTGKRYFFKPLAVVPEPRPDTLTVASAKAFNPGLRLDGALLVATDAATDQPILHVAFGAVLGYYGLAAGSARWDPDRGEVRAGTHVWSVGADGELHARWTGRLGAFPRLEFADALRLLADPKQAPFFRDKLVILGDFRGADAHEATIGRIQGPEFNAELVNTLLAEGKQTVFRWGNALNALWAGLLSLGVVTAVRSGSRGLTTAAIAGSLLAAVLGPGVVQLWARVWIDTVAPFLAVTTALGIAAVWETIRGARLLDRFTPQHVREGRPETETGIATVMFVDLKGSTAISARLGPDRARDLLTELLKRLSAVVTGHGGVVERTLGDGLLAIFRQDFPHHAFQAAEVVAELQQAVAAMSAECERDYGVGVGVTIGLETGTLSGAVIRHATWEEWSSFGPTVNLAARIQGACGALGQNVLVGPACRELIQHRFATEEVARLDLKGVPGPTPVFALRDRQ